jgi:hypothetical protein
MSPGVERGPTVLKLHGPFDLLILASGGNAACGPAGRPAYVSGTRDGGRDDFTPCGERLGMRCIDETRLHCLEHSELRSIPARSTPDAAHDSLVPTLSRE